MSEPARIGILCAMKEEQQMLLQALISTSPAQQHGQRTYRHGRLHGWDVVMVLSGIGKVAAACTATSLITEFACDTLLFTGTAGSLDENVKVGDIVVSGELLQHDLDASPLFPRFEVPLTGKSRFKADARWTGRLLEAARTAVDETLHNAAGYARLQALGIGTPQVHQGLLVSGDRFFNHGDQVRQLREVLPTPWRWTWKAQRSPRSALITACRFPPCAAFQTGLMPSHISTSTASISRSRGTTAPRSCAMR